MSVDEMMGSIASTCARRTVRLTLFSLMAAGAAVVSQPVSAQPYMMYSVNATDKGLSTLDASNGSSQMVGVLGEGYDLPASMAIHPVDGTIYVWNSGDIRGLLTVDSETGAASLVGVSNALFAAMSFTLDARLWGVGNDGGGPRYLFEIDPSTAETTQVGDTLGMNIGGMDLHPFTGVLYGVETTDPGESELLVVIHTDGTVTEIGTLSSEIGRIQSIAFDRNGVLYGTASQSPQGKIVFQIDPVSAVVSNTTGVMGGAPQGLGPLPECPGQGGCCTANGTPGCNDENCCTVVCTLDPFCCETAWDQICADEALQYCLILCMPTGTLALELEVSTICQSQTEICVELWMRDIENTNVTGFRAFISYDDSILNYDAAESDYTDTPFMSHFSPPDDWRIQPGLLDLDGLSQVGDPGTNADAQLATICFDVEPGADCSQTAFTFTIEGPKNDFTHLSYQGVPIFTRTNNTSQVTLDDELPTFTFEPPALTVECTECTDPVPECTGEATATDNCGIATVGHIDNLVPDCDSTGVLTRTWTAVDGCGNLATYVQTITIVDTLDPVINNGLPLGDLTPPADVGYCSAENYEPPFPPAWDNCSEEEDLNFTCTRSDGMHCFNDPYPCGEPITLTWTAIDECLNESNPAQQVVEVECVNEVDITIVLQNVFVDCERCIYFVTDDCSDASQELEFVIIPPAGLDAFSGEATFTSSDEVKVRIPCGEWGSLCLKDRQHTLWDTVPLSIDVQNNVYEATQDAYLLGGDTNDNGEIDIDDATWFQFQWAQPANDGGCPWDETTRDADFSCNGVVGLEDNTLFLFENWDVPPTFCDCVPENVRGVVADAGGGGDARVSPPKTPPHVLELVDLNKDGRYDWQDMWLHEDKYNLGHALSAKMQASTTDRSRR